jgi:hypothetical protein
MGAGTTFDDFDLEGELETDDLQPIWSIKHEDEEKLLEWLKKDWKNKYKLAESRIRVYRENLALYKGLHYKSQETTTQEFRRDAGDQSIRNPKIVVNHVYEMVETKTARLARFKPAIAVLPANDEWNDKQNAKATKLLVDSRWYEADMDKILRDQQKGAFVYGEAFIYTKWNPNIGDIHPLKKKFDERGMEVPMLDEKGQKITNEEGETVTVKSEIRVGDVDYEVIYPDRIFPNIKARVWEMADDVTICDYKNIEELKADYPKKADKIKKSNEMRFDYESFEETKLGNELPIKTYFHKPTKYLPKGMKVVFTDDTVLEKTDFPYTHGKLPFTRVTDIDVPNTLPARSFIGTIRQLQKHYNNLASAISRNHGLASAPKWIMPKGACSIKSLNNEITVVEYKGPVPPRLENMSPTSPEVFGYMDKLNESIQKLSGVHGISRGTPPPGIRAGIALQFLEEQEQERESSAVAKRASAIREVAKQTIALMGQFYKREDGRMVRILGRDNSYLVKSFDMAELSKVYDVRIQNTSSLPESKPAKIQSIIDLNQGFPNLFQREQVIDMLDLATDKAFVDQATVSVKSAEYENEMILSGKEVPEPEEYEDLIIHWSIHVKELQSRTYRDEAPNEIKEKLKEHIMVTEMLMWKRAGKNALFRQKILTLDSYPIFFTLDESSAMVMSSGGMPPEMGAAQGVPQSAPAPQGAPPDAIAPQLEEMGQMGLGE